MAKTKNTIKVLVSVDIDTPDNNAVDGKLKGAELSAWLRERATNDVADALIERNLNPKVLRVRVAREKA
jgi:hypothetical protein